MKLFFYRNKFYHYLFFTIIFLYVIFNGGNSNLLIQLNFLIISFFFYICTFKKNYNSHLNVFFVKNKASITFFFLFLLFIIFQLVPLPMEALKYFSNEKYLLLNQLENSNLSSSLSLSPSNTFFQFLNFLTLFIIVLIINMIFFRTKHVYRFYTFVSILGAFTSSVAIIIYLNGSDIFFIIKNYSNSNFSTVFFVNRTVFSIFLLFCFIASIEVLKNKNFKFKNSNNNFFFKIYIRLFIIIITIGLITTFSRLGNFLFFFTIIIYLIDDIFIKKRKNNYFRNLLFIILIFDILILGLYFGSLDFFDRLLFLKEEFSYSHNIKHHFTRINFIKFNLEQIKEYFFFGYGGGSFETLFKINYQNLSDLYADHVHSDLIEFYGEYGFFGFLLLILSLFSFFKNMNYSVINFILLFYLTTILLLDFSLHIPIIQILFVIFLILNKKKLLTKI